MERGFFRDCDFPRNQRKKQRFNRLLYISSRGRFSWFPLVAFLNAQATEMSSAVPTLSERFPHFLGNCFQRMRCTCGCCLGASSFYKGIAKLLDPTWLAVTLGRCSQNLENYFSVVIKAGVAFSRDIGTVPSTTRYGLWPIDSFY